MTLDVSTLFFLTMHVEAILGLLLLLAWVQNITLRATAWWGAAHLCRSLSVGVYGMYGTMPDWLTIDIAGALLFVSFGLTWCGTRVFNGREPRPFVLLSGALAWIILNHTPALLPTREAQYLLTGIIVAGFSWASAYELWRGRGLGLVSRWPAISLLFALGALFLLRSPLSLLLPHVGGHDVLASAWLTVLSAEALLFSIALAFVLLAMSKEFAELGYKNAARVDSLTGLANRRAFLHDGEATTQLQASRGNPVAVFVIDLDLFKSVNDRFGHATGDRVLRLFAEVCGSRLRANDLVGRIGGEEFGVLIADATRDNAFLVAERIRAAFEQAAKLVDGEEIGATLSVGVAIAQSPQDDIGLLLRQADQALYRAKARGRNRVELAPLPALDQVLPELTQIPATRIAA